MRIITLDVYIKISQRSVSFLASKFHIDSASRTKSSFNETKLEVAIGGIILKVCERWNYKITEIILKRMKSIYVRNFSQVKLRN